MSIKVIAELCKNHQGDVDTALKLIAAADYAGCDLVKFQKRTVDKVYTKEFLDTPRKNHFGSTERDLKYGLEFGKAEYDEINAFCDELGLSWFASPWDEQSVDFLMQYDIPYFKIASASITDKGLLRHASSTGVPLIISTGMADLELIKKVVGFIEDCRGQIACLMHCTSTYPCPAEELNLSGITTLRETFPHLRIGYSAHDTHVSTSLMAAVLGAEMVERHLTLDRAMWGTDHSASLEPKGMHRVVSDIRLWERARGNGNIEFYESETPFAEKLRRVVDF